MWELLRNKRSAILDSLASRCSKVVWVLTTFPAVAPKVFGATAGLIAATRFAVGGQAQVSTVVKSTSTFAKATADRMADEAVDEEVCGCGGLSVGRKLKLAATSTDLGMEGIGQIGRMGRMEGMGKAGP